MSLRFTMRDLLWLTLVVALALGWWSERRWYLQCKEAEIQRMWKYIDSMPLPPDRPIESS